MLNPDGVINGNSRCSIVGCDLNRRWNNPCAKIHPTIYQTKRLIKTMQCKGTLCFYCDFHGHSRKYSSFIYGCSDKNNPHDCTKFP